MNTVASAKVPLTVELPDGRTTKAVYVAGRWRLLPPLWGAELKHRRSRRPYALSAGQRIPVTVRKAA